MLVSQNENRYTFVIKFHILSIGLLNLLNGKFYLSDEFVAVSKPATGSGVCWVAFRQDFLFWNITIQHVTYCEKYEPHRKKTCRLWGFRKCPTQARLYDHRKWPEA